MFGISGAEVIIILLVALVVLGPDRLPQVARKAGQVMGEMRKVSAGFEAEMRTAMYEQERPTPRPSVQDATPTDADPSERSPGSETTEKPSSVDEAPTETTADSPAPADPPRDQADEQPEPERPRRSWPKPYEGPTNSTGRNGELPPLPDGFVERPGWQDTLPGERS